MTKLTLNADKKTIAQAKQLAQEQGISVSAIFSQLIEAMSSSRSASSGAGKPAAPITRRLRGLAKVSSNKTDRELYEAAILKKGRR